MEEPPSDRPLHYKQISVKFSLICNTAAECGCIINRSPLSKYPQPTSGRGGALPIMQHSHKKVSSLQILSHFRLETTWWIWSKVEVLDSLNTVGWGALGLTRMRALLGGEHTSQTPKSTIAELHRIFCHKIIIFHPKCSLIPISSMRAVSSLSCNWSGWNEVFFSADQSSSAGRFRGTSLTLKLLATSFAAKTWTLTKQSSPGWHLEPLHLAAADHQPAAANWQLPPGNWQVPPGFGSWFAPRSFAFACMCCYLRGLKDAHCICSYCRLATGGSAAMLIAGTINFKPNFQMCPQVVNQWSHIHHNQW